MRALLSVSNKKGLVSFAQRLVELGFDLISTGGTMDALLSAGIPVKKVSDYTGSPEILGGRVKTLHPKIHGGILGRPTDVRDRNEMAEHQIEPIDLVVVNLYPFRETIQREDVSLDEAIEQIDIGGPVMVRAAAKNFHHVAVVVDPDDYESVLDEWQTTRSFSSDTRFRLMRKAFAHTAAYDGSISTWLHTQGGQAFPFELSVSFRKVQNLRYGENPHQRGAFYSEYVMPSSPTVAFSRVLSGKELSYNNILDLDAALGLVLEFSESPCAVIIKHNTPCGVAIGETIVDAFRSARTIDEVSAFGGIVALNRPVDASCANVLGETFLEAIMAPKFQNDALAILSNKKNLRLLEAGLGMADAGARARAQLDLRSISGGILVMDRDAIEPEGNWKVVTRRQPTETEWKSMRFAWKICKHVKSNAIVFANGEKMVSAGGGQTSRVDSVKIAVEKGKGDLKGAAMASDAFFPFRDGIDAAVAAGTSCIVQPGGSIRDAELIAAADEYGVSMVFTGIRHFRH